MQYCRFLDLSSQFVVFLRNMFVPITLFIEERGSDASGGSGGGAGLESTLSAEAAATRRFTCASFWTAFIFLRNTTGAAVFLMIANVFGTMLGLTMAEGARTFTGGYMDLPDQSANRLPAAAYLLRAHFSEDASDGKRKPLYEVALDPFYGPIYRKYCCVTCGLLPGRAAFQVCSLCKDPAVGHFCCKEPCFAAFWRGGHKNTCAGRDKMKKKGKGGSGGSGGAGAPSGSGVTGT
jgi:hypothetical protein